MQAAAIVLLCVGAAIVYGVLHDLVTAHVCVEYFTIGHPPVFPTEDPVWLALGWGALATWWVGMILGWGLVTAARVGGRPPRSVRSLVRPVALLMIVSGTCAAVVGVVGYFVAEAGGVVLLQPLAAEVPVEKHTRFLADLWAHTTSYAVGFGGGIVVLVRVWRSRRATER
jgi:hypothetical protein